MAECSCLVLCQPRSYKLVTAMPHVCYSLNRMHIMEDEGSKPSATLESMPKASRSPTPCQNAVQAVDSPKRGVCSEESATMSTNKDDSQQMSPSNELPETSKTLTVEEEEIHKEKEGTVRFLCLFCHCGHDLNMFHDRCGAWYIFYGHSYKTHSLQITHVSCQKISL